MIVSTQTGFNGDKLVEKESGSGNVITEKTELEAERQIDSHCGLCAACIGNEEFEKLYGKFFNNFGPVSSNQFGWSTGFG